MIRSLINFFTAAFYPKQLYDNLDLSGIDVRNTKTTFVFAIAFISVVYSISNLFLLKELLDRFFIKTLLFASGLLFRSLFTGYLMFLIINRIVSVKIKWVRVLYVITFSLFPIASGIVFYIFFGQSSWKVIALSWYSVLLIYGIYRISKIEWWKATIIVLSVLISIKLVASVLFGIEI